MTKIDRRDFLRLLALTAGSAAAAQALAACGRLAGMAGGTPTNTPFNPEYILPPTETPTLESSATPEATATETATPEPTATATSEAAYLAVTRGGDDPEALVRRAVAALGGMERFVSAGANVIVKPNVCVASRSYKFAATTNPWVVGAVVKLCREAGASRVRVFDYPFGGSSADAYNVSGIAEQVGAAGGELEYVDWNKFVSMQLPNAKSLGYADFYSEVINADTVINVPIAKNHGTTRLTLGMKNMMGVVLDRGAIHNDIYRRIAELADFVRPELTIVDGIRILLADGPTGGSLNEVAKKDTIIASADIVAADAYATRLFDWTDPNQLGYVRIGAEMGLGRSDLDNLQIEEIAVGG